MIKNRMRKWMIAVCCITCFLGSHAWAQYNGDYRIGNYNDRQSSVSIVDIGNGEVITIGGLKDGPAPLADRDIIITRIDQWGKIIWNQRYGVKSAHEDANVVTLGWDEKHVIIGGAHQERNPETNELIGLSKILVMKIRISDGALIWTRVNTTNTNDKCLMIKRSESNIVKGYLAVGESVELDNSKTSMNAARITEFGNIAWLSVFGFDSMSIHPNSMEQNGSTGYMIAGHLNRTDGTSKAFVMGVRGTNGTITHDLMEYGITGIPNIFHCTIDKHPLNDGWAISLTTDVCSLVCPLEDDDNVGIGVDRIGVLRLDNLLNVKWGSVYWMPKTTGNTAVSIEFKGSELDLGVNFNKLDKYNTPGLLSLDKNGLILDCKIYHVPEDPADLGPIANNMIRMSTGEYMIKSLYQGIGFSLVNPDLSGNADCDKKVELVRCAFTTSVEKLNVAEFDARFPQTVTLSVFEHAYLERFCDPSKIAMDNTEYDTAREYKLPVQPNQLKLFPSPLNNGQRMLNVSFISGYKCNFGVIKVYSMLGEELIEQELVIIEGENRFELDLQGLTKGTYFLFVGGEGVVVEQEMFVIN